MKISHDKILITGGSGFIGSNLITKLLQEDVEITVVDKKGYASPNVEFIKMDVSRPSQKLRKIVEDSDIIYHLAAYSSVVMYNTFLEPYVHNVNSLLHILSYASRSKGVKRVIFPSSSTVYVGSEMPWTEDKVAETPTNWYSASKMTGEMLCKYYSSHKNIETVCLRIFCGYGPGEEPKGIFASPISHFVLSMVRGISPEIWGNGAQERDFVFIDDIVNALLLASKTSDSNVFNVGTGTATSFIDVINVINDLLGTGILPRFVKPLVPRYIHKTLAETTKALKELGFSAKISVVDGIRQMISKLASSQVQEETEKLYRGIEV